MISFAQAQDILQQQNITINHETIPLAKINGRILAKSIFATNSLPGFRNSAMDGFALNSQWVNNQSQNQFIVKNTIKAGEVVPANYNSQMICAVMTGAYVPECYDTVIPIEQVEQTVALQEKIIQLSKPVKAKQHIRNVGEDVLEGELILEQGVYLSAKEQALLMALGIEDVTVFARSKVALLTTGNEVCDSGKGNLPLGMLYNSNAVYLKQKLVEHGAVVDYLGIIPDSPSALKKVLLKIMEQDYDAIITTGAVSAGDFDFVPSVLKNLQAEILFHKVTMRPGKPILLGRLPSKQLIFALPGNPVSAVVGLEFFVLPWFRQVMHRKSIQPIFTKLKASTIGKKGFTVFKKAQVQVYPHGVVSNILTGQMSFQLKPLLAANAWVKLSGECGEYSSGSLVETYYQQ